MLQEVLDQLFDFGLELEEGEGMRCMSLSRGSKLKKGVG
jgi:hypothetical protein